MADISKSSYTSVMDKTYPSSEEEVDKILSRESLDPVDILALLGGPGIIGKALTGASLMAQSNRAEAGISSAIGSLISMGFEKEAQALAKATALPKRVPPKAGDMFGMPKSRTSEKFDYSDKLIGSSVKQLVRQGMRERSEQPIQRQFSLFEEELMPFMAQILKGRQ